MLSKLQKLPLSKRKAILWSVTIVAGIFLFSWQFSMTKERVTQEEFSFFSNEEKKAASGITERRSEIGELFQKAREEMDRAMRIDEEEIIEKLLQEGLIKEEDIEKLLQDKGLKREELEEGDLLKLIEKTELIKEENAQEERGEK